MSNINQKGHLRVNIRLATIEDSRQVAGIHHKEITRGFLSELGEEFLEEFYRSIIRSEAGFCVVVKADGNIVGFVSGCTNLDRFYKDFFKKHTLKALRILFPKIFNLKRIKKIIETLFYPKKERTLPKAELLTIAVKSEFHGKGIAEEMFNIFVDEMKRRGVVEFKVLVGECLERAIGFYEKLGFKLHSKTSIHKGETSRIYIYESSPAR